MKESLCIFLLITLQLTAGTLMAQNWVNGGNALTGNGALGTTTNFSVLFKASSSERGRITNTGLWGFGTTNPNSIVHINSTASQVPLRVQVNGTTKLFVHNGGGVAIGSSATPPANGSLIAGNTGIGISAPENKLHVFKGSAGNVTGYSKASLLVENSSNCYINILAPDVSETGILFGRPNSGIPAGNVDGGIIYNAVGTPNGLQFRSNGNMPRMILNSRGQLGVGIDPDWYKLKVLVGDLPGIDGLGIANTAGDEWGLTPVTAGLNLAYNRIVKGNFNTTTGDYIIVSDERLKTNIKPMEAMLGKIMRLKPSTYQFKNLTDKQEYNGFIAQDVMELFPAMVSHVVEQRRRQDVYVMDYSQFGVLATKAIQELQPIIKEQQEKIVMIENGYKSKIADLEDRLAKMEDSLKTITVF
jgi:hypothetical protein